MASRSGNRMSSSQHILSQGLQSRLKVLKETLKECGAILSLDDEPNILSQEQALVVRDLEDTFEGKSKQTVDIHEFLSGLKILCGKEKHFRKALLPTEFRKADETNLVEVKMQQESLIRLLLKVKCLQQSVLDILLDEITTIVSEESEDTSWLRLLIHPMRYLPYLQNASALAIKLLDILDVGTYASQLEILDSLPEILPDSQSSDVTKQLCKLLDEKDELSGAIIDCLNALHLGSDVRQQVQDTILAKILSGTSIKIFPILLEFLLTECKSQNLVPTLLQIRNALDGVLTEKCTDHETSHALIFNKLQTYATTPKIVSESWLSMIAGIKSHADHKPVDFLILFMLHCNAKMKKRIIELIFKKRVRDGLFKPALLEKLFEKYFTKQLFLDYFQTMVDIGCSLLRTSQKEPLITEFACTFFKELFKHPSAEVIYRQELLNSLILLTGTNDKKDIAAILSIFSDLLSDITKMQQHTILLMRLLEKIDSFDLPDVKNVFEILCSLTCGERADEAMSGLKDEIHMIVRKQLSSSKREIKHRGIISAVVMSKHTATVFNEQQNDSGLSDVSLNISSLPAGPAKEAAILLELANTCCMGCPELMGLFYDQLAAMVVTKQDLNKYFVAWLNEIITNDFQETFVKEAVEIDRINDVKCYSQFSQNNESEMETPIAVNIAELTLTPEKFENSSILILAPQFRLLRLLHRCYQNNDLSNIDALLGCPVVLPDLNDIEMLDSHQIRGVADCIFHCINWFREIVSGFVTQKSKKLRVKVLNRLRDILELEEKLQICMQNVPDHKLPVSYYESSMQSVKQVIQKEAKLKKPPKKKFKSAETVHDDTVASTSAAANNTILKGNPKKKPPMLECSKIKFREMDSDILVLLRYTTKLDDDLIHSTPLTQSSTISLKQVNFILNDFVLKLKTMKESPNDFMASKTNPQDMLKECVHILQNVNKHLLVAREKLKTLITKADGVYDAPDLFKNETMDYRNCFGLALECYELVFSWTGFQSSKNLDLLRQILQSLRMPSQSQYNSALVLIIDLINRLSGYIEQCLDLNQALSIVRTMQSLYEIMNSDKEDVRKKIIAVCGKILARKWYNKKGNLDSGKQYSENLDKLIKIYLGGANIKTLCAMVSTLQTQVKSLNSKEDSLPMFTSIDKPNFYIFYRGICNALQNQVKVEIQSLTNQEHLVLWKTIAFTLQGLMAIAKDQETKTNLVCFLKKSIAILKVFLSHGIPIMEIMLRSKPDEVVEILKALQTSTRFLHHLCCYSKLNKDTGLLAHVPQFRLVLETLVYRVKAALVANNCSAAFWMGNLRNRDLQGEDILSQNSSRTDSTVEGEEELPEDDEGDDLLDGLERRENNSDSEVY